MIDGRNFFDQPINIRRIATGQGDDYTTGSLLDYSYLKENYKMIAIDLSKQQALDADPRAIQQINFTANLNRDDGATIFLLLSKQKKLFLSFHDFKSFMNTKYSLYFLTVSNDIKQQFKCKAIKFKT